ncbi:MAG TPA: hypothetical protein VM223_12340 [Planctomycetota bacterium]|nr:hypothetical protein [Planctomycetota bacterium]
MRLGLKNDDRCGPALLAPNLGLRNRLWMRRGGEPGDGLRLRTRATAAAAGAGHRGRDRLGRALGLRGRWGSALAASTSLLLLTTPRGLLDSAAERIEWILLSPHRSWLLRMRATAVVAGRRPRSLPLRLLLPALPHDRPAENLDQQEDHEYYYSEYLFKTVHGSPRWGMMG